MGVITKKAVSIFLFAHQDDEYGVFQMIETELDDGKEVLCLYFTDGGKKSLQRNRESFNVLTGMGVPAPNIQFFGEALGIKDGKLSSSVNVCADKLREILSRRQGVNAVYVPAWEGGHPDHDSLHFTVANVMNECGMIDKLLQFSLYHAKNRRKPFFRVMAPLKENGDVLRISIPFKRRWKYVYYCLCYPSQLLSWIGLFPHVAFSYLFIGQQCLQPVSLARLRNKPHEGWLYYEARGFANYHDVIQALSTYRQNG